MGGFKGKKGKGKGFGGPYDRLGPTLEEPPQYPLEKFPGLRPCEPVGKEDIAMIVSHRRMQGFLRHSVFHERFVLGSAGAGGSTSSTQGYLKTITSSKTESSKDEAEAMDSQMREILTAGGTCAKDFPVELTQKHQLRLRGKMAQGSVFDILQKLQAREKAKSGKEESDKKQEGAGDDFLDLEDDADDDDFGGEDYNAGYEDFEDGMGNDFDEDAGGGAGEADY
eukprot:TRINITY_DN28455_c0_g1_i1.p1 TRINITY_DN28455_c0_g1~~TRINITY_DN28455_c0_g1_i1.p1  ORF type:complete len:224 (-),score=73.47 TRINITY_DN28455_c0_g1_i1:164-835(-)